MPSLEQIHQDLCWVIYFSQKGLVETNLHQNPQPQTFLNNLQPFQYLFDPKLIKFLSNFTNSDDEKTRSLAQSLKFLLIEYGGILENFKVLMEFQITRSNTRLRVLSYDVEKRISVSEAFQLSFNSELTRYIRMNLHDAYSGFYLKKTPIFKKVLDIYFNRAKALKFHNIYEMLQDGIQFNLDDLESQIVEYLERTKEDFQSELKFHIEDRSGMTMNFAHATDLRISFDPSFLPAFDRKKKLKIFQKLDTDLEMNCLNRKIEKVENFYSNFPFAVRLIHPTNFSHQYYLIYNRNEKMLDWRLLFREIGHLFYYSNISPKIPLINQMTGDLINYELTAKVFEKLMFESTFLRENFGYDSKSLKIPKFQYDIENRNVLINSLHQIRLFKNKEYSEYRLKQIKLQYEEIFYEYFGFYRQGYDYLSQIDFKLYSILAKSKVFLMLDETYSQIQKKYSEEWWKNKEFGKYLKKKLFKSGFKNFQKKIDV